MVNGAYMTETNVGYALIFDGGAVFSGAMEALDEFSAGDIGKELRVQ
jgi:hypothetical protein